MRIKTLFLSSVIIAATLPAMVSANSYTTSISPSGTSISNPITATFDIQDFGQKDYNLSDHLNLSCDVAFVPAEMLFNYLSDTSDLITIDPVVIPTSEMIESGIYTATFSLAVGLSVHSIGVEFTGADGTACGFHGRQPNGAPVVWGGPLFIVAPPPIFVIVQVLPPSNAPQVSAKFPVDAIWSGEKTITYTATDSASPPYHLKDLPMSFYLSHNDGRAWLEIAKDKSNSGTFTFNTSDFPDGEQYKFKISAADNAGLIGEIFSGKFGIDNMPTSFTVKVDKEFIQEKDKINLTIVSSENLKETPEVSIIQNGAEPKTLVVSGARKDFTASYTITRGYPGKAVVSIKGKDLAGNIGGEITSGGTFLVHRFGPPPPAVSNIADNESLSAPDINVLGEAPEALKVHLTLNDKARLTTKPDSKGGFTFKGITLNRENRGFNTLKISSVDKNGIESIERILTVKLNSPPEISWIRKPMGSLSGIFDLEWSAVDANGDELTFQILYSVDGGKSWGWIARGVIDKKYSFDASEFFAGDHNIKIIADDGSAKSEVVSDRLSFGNRSAFSINIPPNLLMSVVEPSFEGNISLPVDKITSVRYSLDKEVWEDASPMDGTLNSSSEKFSIKFTSPLLDGKHLLFIEARDDKARVYRTFRPFIVDTLPPIAPKITSFQRENVITSKMDKNPTLGGIQFNISGEAEAGAEVEVNLNSRTYKTSAGSKGKSDFGEMTFLSRGINRYTMSSRDAVGNISEISGIIISNNPPELTVSTLQNGASISGTKEIKWSVSDEDGDPIALFVSYRQEGSPWILLADNLKSDTFYWDTSKLAGGEYALKVAANDGLVETERIIEGLLIDNIRPTITLDVSGPVFSPRILPLFSGSAGDDFLGVDSVEYTIDGSVWFKATLIEGLRKKNAIFVIKYPLELEDGEYDFGVRSVDAAGNVSEPVFVKISVDASPPRIGSLVLSRGRMNLLPQNGTFTVVTHAPLRLALSLEKDAERAELSVPSLTEPVHLSKSN